MDPSLASWFRRFPEGWWGYHWSLPTPMSAVELIGSGSLDARLMAALWAVVARRKSVMLASEAPMAGKTTTLSALVDFLPDETTAVFLAGWRADERWTAGIDPHRAYLLVNELSDHLPIYVWGRNARLALRLAAEGWGLGATMHADTLPGAVALLRDELGAPDSDLAGMTVYLQYSAYRTPEGIYRRVEEAWHLRLDATGSLAPVRLAELEGGRSPSLDGAQRLPVPPMLSSDGGRGRRPLVHDQAAYTVLAETLGVSSEVFERELAARTAFLLDLAARGVCSPPAVAAAVASFEAPA